MIVKREEFSGLDRLHYIFNVPIRQPAGGNDNAFSLGFAIFLEDDDLFGLHRLALVARSRGSGPAAPESPTPARVAVKTLARMVRNMEWPFVATLPRNGVPRKDAPRIRISAEMGNLLNLDYEESLANPEDGEDVGGCNLFSQ